MNALLDLGIIAALIYLLRSGNPSNPSNPGRKR